MSVQDSKRRGRLPDCAASADYYLITRSLPRGGAFGLSGEGVSGTVSADVFCIDGARDVGAMGDVMETDCKIGVVADTCVGLVTGSGAASG